MSKRWTTSFLLVLVVSACGGTEPGSGADGGKPGDGGPGGGTADANFGPDASPQPPPVMTWKEHWFEHDQLVELVYFDDHVAIYFDSDVQREGTEWLLPFMSKLWQYTKATYGGDYGPDPRLYSIHHENKYSGGHPSTYFDESHDFRNVSDIGPGGWTNPDDVDIASHEVSHIVEGASFGVHGSPAFGIWHDSKWAEFFQYDVYVALDMPDHAEQVFDRFTNTVDDFPRPGTRWFRDWFYPLWRDHGHAQVMANYFRLLSENFPKNGKDYARDLNFGEFIHFMSGAAGEDLESMATAAFGWTGETDQQFNAAKAAFPGVTYGGCAPGGSPPRPRRRLARASSAAPVTAPRLARPTRAPASPPPTTAGPTHPRATPACR